MLFIFCEDKYHFTVRYFMAQKIVYFDIETTNRCVDWMRGESDSRYAPVEKWEIITVQWQEIDPFTGEELGELNIVKRWEKESELEFLETVFSSVGNMAINYSYKFYDRKEEKDVEIPKSVNNFLFSENPAKLGHNLKFEQLVLDGKIEQWNSRFLSRKGKPIITYGWNVDLMPFAILRSGYSVDSMGMEFSKKGGETRGSSLHNISCKETSGRVIQEMYDNKDWNSIEGYIKKETRCAIETYKQLLEHMKDWNYKEIN